MTRAHEHPAGWPDRIRAMVWSGVLSCACAVIMAGQAPAQPARDVTAVVREARQLASAGKLEPAQQMLERLVGEKPDAFEALLALGEVLEGRGDLTAAAGMYERAVRARPSSAAAHDRLGFALGRLTRVTEALVEFERAVQLDPALFDPQYHLGATRWWRVTPFARSAAC